MTNRTITTDLGREDGNQTLEYYQDRLDQAWDTLRRLPIPELCQKMTHWPTMVRQTAEVTALNPKSLRIPLAGAKPKDITKMDETLLWLMKLGEQDRKLLWARTCRLSWRKLAAEFGRSHVTIRSWHKQSLARLRETVKSFSH